MGLVFELTVNSTVMWEYIKTLFFNLIVAMIEKKGGLYDKNSNSQCLLSHIYLTLR